MLCKGCKREFIATCRRQLYCNRKCERSVSKNPARDLQRHFTADLEFVGVDGEGVTRPDGRHEYIMLSVGDQTLWKEGRELTWQDIFPWLYERFKEGPERAFVGFFLGYDFLQWTKRLSEEDGRSLWSKEGQEKRKPKRKGFIQSFPVVVERTWEVDVLANKRLRLRPHTHRRLKNDPIRCFCGAELELEEIEWEDSGEEFSWDDLPTLKKEDKKGEVWMYITDTGPYWQSSFLAAINPKKWPLPVVSEEEYKTLKEGKEGRGDVVGYGEIGFYEEMRRYNLLENEVLGRVTTALNEGFCSVGVKIPREKWFGPGQAASLWMKGVSKKSELAFTRKALFDEGRVPRWVEAFARKTYYGGWFEQFMHGAIEGKLWEYDLNSAYPFIISRLPCLHHAGQWEQGEGEIREEREREGVLWMVKAEFLGSDPYVGCMPFRDRQGRILRVHRGSGWYWKHELDAAVRAGIVDLYKVEEWVRYSPCGCKSPLAGIAELYELRLKVGKGSPQGKALKLLYNSVYGKFAQSIGNPLFGNPIYASLITAGCRTMILDAIATHPEKTRAVSMVATDGVYFRSKHPYLEIDKERLGAWDVSVKHDVTQFMPGLYWGEEVRERLKIVGEEQIRKEGGLPIKTRGVNARDLVGHVREIDRKFSEAMEGFIRGRDYEWPKFDVPVRFDIVSPGQALARGKWETCGIVHGEEHNVMCGDECRKGKKSISSSPVSKRMVEGIYPVMDIDVVRSGVYTGIEGQYETMPYKKMFGDEEMMGEVITQEGGQFLEWFFKNGGDTGE